MATGRGNRRSPSPAKVPATNAAIPIRRGPGAMRGLKGRGDVLRQDGASQGTATAERPEEATVPLAAMLAERDSEAGETLRQQLERRWRLEFAEPADRSSEQSRVFIRRRSTATVTASVAQPRSRGASPRPQRASGSPGPSGRAEQKSMSTTRARAASATAATAASRAAKSRRDRASLPVMVRASSTATATLVR